MKNEDRQSRSATVPQPTQRRCNLMVLKTQSERLATIRRMAALPGSGVRPDQAVATAQAFDKLLDQTEGGSSAGRGK